MRYCLLSLIVVLLLYSSAMEAQTNVSVRRKDFKNDKPGFEEAWKHVTQGDYYYKAKGVLYTDAFDEYIKAFIYNNSNPELNYKIGVAALMSDNKEEAAGFFIKALELKSDVADDILFLTGHALQYSGNFSEAVDKLNSYLDSPGKKPEKNIIMAKKFIDECNSSMILTKDTLRIGINNAGAAINSSADDYSEIFSADGNTMFLASRRELPGSGNNYPDSKFDENIFISRLNNDIWGSAVIAGKNLATKYCESPLYLNSAGDRLYIYAGYENNGDIMMSVNKNNKWKTPRPVKNGINTKGSETSFTFSPSGNEIYFVSDHGKDNSGGKDIYFIKKLSERKWSKPKNAGPLINTVYDEESVRFSITGDTLWFSSKGHNSIGGFDIFYSVRNKSGIWEVVKNYGYPVNTQWDEIFYQPSMTDDSTFYFASNRVGGYGGLDIYQGRIMPPIPPEPEPVVIEVVPEVLPPVVPVVVPEPVKEPEFFLSGKIKDSETGEPVIAKIDIIDIETDTSIITTVSNDLDGSYKVIIPKKKSFMIDIRATGFLSEKKQIEIPETYVQDVFYLDAALMKMKIGKRVVLNNILFESGKSILTSGSYTELDRLLKILQDNPLMKIEISGHTDKTGSEAINSKLSADRAKAVVEYLVQKGIDRSRIESKGFGSLQPVSDNATPQGRGKNRRVEFKILEF
jgi:outer membrane protein OmpA-like peptidoglycan-associated protein/tetratricopeptide (TPR) repeat protein